MTKQTADQLPLLTRYIGTTADLKGLDCELIAMGEYSYFASNQSISTIPSSQWEVKRTLGKHPEN